MRPARGTNGQGQWKLDRRHDKEEGMGSIGSELLGEQGLALLIFSPRREVCDMGCEVEDSTVRDNGGTR